MWQKIGLRPACTIFVQVGAKKEEQLSTMGIARNVTNISLELENGI